MAVIVTLTTVYEAPQERLRHYEQLTIFFGNLSRA